MIFCFPLNFLAQPLSQVMDSFIPQFSSSATPPNHHPHPPLAHSIHSPSTHLPTWRHPSTHTTSLTHSPIQPPPHYLSTCSATHPPFHPFTQQECSPIHALFYPPSIISFTIPSLHPALSREPASYLSSFIICPSCTSIYPTVHGALPVPGPRCSLPCVV